MIKEYFVLFISILADALSIAIIVRIFMSWMRVNQHGAIAKFVYDITDPILGLFKKVIPPIGMFDLSPIAAILAIDLVRFLVLSFV